VCVVSVHVMVKSLDLRLNTREAAVEYDLGRLFTHMSLCHQTVYNFVPVARLQCPVADGKLSVGPASQTA